MEEKIPSSTPAPNYSKYSTDVLLTYPGSEPFEHDGESLGPIQTRKKSLSFTPLFWHKSRDKSVSLLADEISISNPRNHERFDRAVTWGG